MWTLAWWWMLFLLPLPWLVRRTLPPASVERDAALVAPAGSRFATLTLQRAGGSASNRRLVGLWAVWVLAVLAATRPQYVGEPMAVPMTGRDLALAVDLSGT